MRRFCWHEPPSARLIYLLRVVQWASFGLVVAAWAGWLAVRGGPLPGSLLATASAAVSGLVARPPEGLPGSSAELRPELRPPAPDFTLPLFDGGTLQLADLRGQVVVLNFWASWCPPCRAEAPTFARVSQAFQERGVVFVGVNVQDTEPDARAFLAEFGIRYPNGPDTTTQIATDYGVAGIPTTLFLDAQGRIARRWLGALDERQLTAFSEELLP